MDCYPTGVDTYVIIKYHCNSKEVFSFHTFSPLPRQYRALSPPSTVWIIFEAAAASTLHPFFLARLFSAPRQIHTLGLCKRIHCPASLCQGRLSGGDKSLKLDFRSKKDIPSATCAAVRQCLPLLLPPMAVGR
jgi:hypothetical protein